MSKKRFVLTASTFDRKGRHIATRNNSYTRSHPLMKHFALLVGESEHKHSTHAELAAMLASRDREVHSILVQRFDAFGNPKLAKPCKTCQKMLESFGVRFVRYTAEEGVKEYEN